jgi:uncharacterized membrane protein YkoI
MLSGLNQTRLASVRWAACSRDHEQGKVIYEVEFISGGKEYELDIAEDGKLLERRLD